MKKEDIIQKIKDAASAGNVEEIQYFTSLLNTLEPVEPVKKKRGRPKKVKETVSVAVETEDGIEEYDLGIESVDAELPQQNLKRSKKEDHFVNQFKIETQKNAFNKKTGKNIGWSKNRKIDFMDTQEAIDDVKIDKLLKVQANVPRDRPAVKKVKITCFSCGNKFTTYTNNIQYYVDEQEGKTLPVPMRCNNCMGSK